MAYCTAAQVRTYATQAPAAEVFAELIAAATAWINSELVATFDTDAFTDPPHQLIQTITAKKVAADWINTKYALATVELHELAALLERQAVGALQDIITTPYKLTGVDPLELSDLDDMTDYNAVLLNDAATEGNVFDSTDPRDW